MAKLCSHFSLYFVFKIFKKFKGHDDLLQLAGKVVKNVFFKTQKKNSHKLDFDEICALYRTLFDSEDTKTRKLCK